MHHHNHDHQHTLRPQRVTNALIAGIVLNMVYVVAEAASGFYNGSLSLLTDAGHNLSDVASLALSLIAVKLAAGKPNLHFTYGLKKSTILVALINALLLLLVAGSILIEAIHRIGEPVEQKGEIIAWVAGAGIVINTFTALLFFRDKEHDINVKGAYLHLAADALVSLGVVAGGILMAYTGWYWLDSIISLVIIVVIVLSTWGLLKDSLNLSLDGVPRDITIENIREALLKTNGVKDIHHIHVWALSTTQNALTAHVLLDASVSTSQQHTIRKELKHTLEHMKIGHATLEFEWQNDCGESSCKD